MVITGSGQSGYDTAALWIGNGTNSWNIATANNNYCTAATPFTFMLPAGWSCQCITPQGILAVNIQTWYEFSLAFHENNPTKEVNALD